MKKSTTLSIVVAVAAVLGFWINTVTIGHGQATPRWQYGVFHEFRIGEKSFYGFLTTAAKTGDGLTLAEFLTKYTGTTRTQATYSDVWNALGADGWELVQAIETHGALPATDHYFKRLAN